MSFGLAIKTYTLLTVGDGLAAQFPALIVSTAAGIVVTKAASSRRALGEDFALQIMANPRIFFLLSGILFVLGVFMRGASSAFWVLSFCIGAIGFWARHKHALRAEALTLSEEARLEKVTEQALLDTPHFSVQVGLGLAHQLSTDSNLQGDLDRFVVEMKSKKKTDLPCIRICDSSDLDLFEYSFFTPEGEEIYAGKLKERDYYLIATEGLADLDARLVRDELLARPCAWIGTEERDAFVQRGFVVVRAGELFRWHLYLSYRRMLAKTKEQELIYGIQNL